MLRIFINVISLTLFYCNGIFFTVHCVEFNRDITGVIFQPYVLNSTKSYATSFTFEEVKTMLKVTSGRFCRVATVSISNTGSYEKNVTYYKTYSEIYTAEAAATLNHEAISTNSSLKFSVYIGVYLHKDPKKMNSEIKLAFEAVTKSNQIYQGTSLGLVLFHLDISKDVTIANLALSEVQKIKEEAQALNLTLGIKTNCHSYNHISTTPENMLVPLDKVKKLFLLHIDFIVCNPYYSDTLTLGLNKTVALITKDMNQQRESIHLINPNVEFMVQSKISTPGSTKKQYQFQLDFWTMMDQWATRNNIPIWVYEAFDNPWKAQVGLREAHNGWWIYTTGQSLTDVSSYEEKVSQLLVTTSSGITSTKKLPSEQYNTSLQLDKSTTAYAQPDTKFKPHITLSDREPSSLVYIGSIVGPSIAIVGLVLLAVHWIRTNKFRRSLLTREEIKGFVYGPSKQRDDNMQDETIETQVLHKPYDKSFEISKKRFQICWSSILGCGEYGVVYKAYILASENQNPELVALKMTKDNCPKTAVMSILSEIKILLYLGQHDNLVSIKGAYTAEIAKGVVYIATELCELGSLKSFLRRAPKIDKAAEICEPKPQSSTQSTSQLQVTEMVRWSFEIACGMEYLAEKNVIHADLAARNVLLNADKIAKITDFGLSRRLYEYTNYVKKQQEPLPWRWMAIEALKKLEFSTQSDVWSFGVTLWEIFSMGDVPYPGLSGTLDFVDSLETGLRMKCPRLASPEIYGLMSSCWEQEPQNRPTFTQLKQSLARMIEFNSNSPEGLDDQLYYIEPHMG